MDVSVAASMFDDQPVYDKYTDELLFLGQTLPYDGSVRDSVASWRQSLSAAKIVKPARGVIYMGDETFITGRVVQDFFQGDLVRENVILHPCDDTYTRGSAADFLTVPIPAGLTEFYGGVAWRKSVKDERESPELHNVCDIYFAAAELRPDPDSIIVSGDNMMYRVVSVEYREGGFIVAVCSELGQNKVVDANYTTKGMYESGSDSTAASAPVALKAIVELAKTNFKFVVADTAKYEPGDRVITIRVADVAAPKAEDLLVAEGVTYRVISAHTDEDGGSWELHCRRQ